ncbi:MAG: FHA domain-containing protein [Planctomycetes bacterium]|nr:FHA domain-containing protein [Planctomycetota bacterium]
MSSVSQNAQGPMKSAVLLNVKTGREYVLDDVTTLGRLRRCDVAIVDEKVSRYHARIIRSGKTHVIEDLESSNGTYVQGRRVHDPVPLRDGYRIVIGDATFCFSLRKAARPKADAERPSVLLERGLKPTTRHTMKAFGYSLLDESLATDDTIDMARLRSQARRFREVMRRLQSQRGLDALIEELAKQLMQVFQPADHSIVALREPEAGITVCADERRDPKDREPVRIGRPVIDKAMGEGMAFITEEGIGDRRSEGESSRERIFRVAMIAPLILSERTMGVVYVDGLTPTCRFGRRDLSLVVAITNEAAQLIDVMQLYERTRQERDRLREENKRLRVCVPGGHDFGRIVGPSQGIKLALGEARRASRTDVGVLIHGEAGTGKGLFARTIHENSKRRTGPFVRVDCAAVDRDVCEERFFGQERTGREGKPEKGFLEQANGGTLYLENVADLSAEVQVRLADVLQVRALRRVGGVTPVAANVRILAATREDLEQEVKENRFNKDLYVLLSAAPIALPPLSERLEDLPALARHFCSKLCKEVGKSLKGFTSDGIEALEEYAWPGNVRELRNLVECLILGAKPGSSIGRRNVGPFLEAKRRVQNYFLAQRGGKVS